MDKIAKKGFYLGVKVKQIELINQIYYGVVQGRDEYNVSVRLENNKFESGRCTCPSQAYPCKHIYALIEAIKDLPPQVNLGKKSITDVLMTIEREKIVDFFTYLLNQNSQLNKEFEVFFADELGLNRHKFIIDEFLDITSEFQQLSDDASSYNYHYEFLYCDLFEQKIHKLLAKIKKYVAEVKSDRAFCLLKELYQNFDEMNNFETDENIDFDFSETVLLLMLDLPITPPLFDFFIDIVKNNSYLTNHLLDTITERFNSKEQKQMIYQALKEGSTFSFYLDQFKELATQLEISDQQFLAVVETEWDSYKVQKFLIENCKESADYQRLEKYLVKFYNKSNYWEDELIEFYQKFNHDKLKTLLSKLIKKDFSIYYYKQLKELYSPDEWLTIRDQYIKCASSYDKEEVYFIEEMFVELVKIIDWVNCPRDYLSTFFPTHQKAINKAHIERIARLELIVKEDAYWSIADLIERIDLPGNEEVVKEVLTPLATNYCRKRPLMNKILSKLIEKHLICQSNTQ